MTENSAPAFTDPATANKQAAYFTVGATLLAGGAFVVFPLLGALAVFGAIGTLAMEQVINVVFGGEEPEKAKPQPLAVQVWNGLSNAFGAVKADLRQRFFGGPKLEEIAVPVPVVELAAPAVAEKTVAKDFEASVKPAVVAQAPAPTVAPAAPKAA